MKFLIDVCAGQKLALWLIEQGHDVLEVREKNCRLADEDILSLANSENRILVTMDKDFSELAVLKKTKHSGMIRLENLPLDMRIRYLSAILLIHETDLFQGAIIIQKGSKLRVIHQ